MLNEIIVDHANFYINGYYKMSIAIKYLKDKTFLLGLRIWTIATLAYFIFASMDFAVSPIAENGLMSLLTIYIPVLLLSILLLLYLTRKRESVEWSDLYCSNRQSIYSLYYPACD